MRCDARGTVSKDRSDMDVDPTERNNGELIKECSPGVTFLDPLAKSALLSIKWRELDRLCRSAWFGKHRPSMSLRSRPTCSVQRLDANCAIK